MGIHITKLVRPTRRKAGKRDPGAPTGLADALFTTTRQRVLGLLFGQPGRSFFATELIALTGSGSGAVQRELKRLESSGLVTTTRFGNQKHFQADPQSPVFHELHGLMIKTVALAEPLRCALEPLVDRIDLALIYGSVVKGTDTSTSDIDILVVSNELTLEDVYSAFAPVESSLGRRISPVLYTRREYVGRRASKNAFLGRVLAGDNLVLIGRVDEPSPTRQPRAHRQAEGRTGGQD